MCFQTPTHPQTAHDSPTCLLRGGGESVGVSAFATAQEHDAAQEEDDIDEQQQQDWPVQVDPIGGGTWWGRGAKNLKINIRNNKTLILLDSYED